MATRLFLILALVVPQLWLPAAFASAQAAPCGDRSCCRVTEVRTCCETVVRRVCAKSGGPCQCNVDSNRPERQVPPAPRAGLDLAFLALASGVAIVHVRAPAAIDPPCRQDRRVASHNLVQALLGVWRT